MDAAIVIHGKRFELIRAQREGTTGVYRGAGEYLRLGERSTIERHLSIHKDMGARGYPVARLLDEGEVGSYRYFIEASLGESPLGDLFARDWHSNDAVSDTHFAELLTITKKVAHAQLQNGAEPQNVPSLAETVHLNLLCNELPSHAFRIRDRYREAEEHLRAYPLVLSHGDLNPQNMFGAGVIDLENAFSGPFGYDLVTVLLHIDQFPDSGNFEFVARYGYTTAQKEAYLTLVDDIARAAALPPLSERAIDFEFCRATWSTARMHRYPKLQAWRYSMFIKRFLA